MEDLPKKESLDASQVMMNASRKLAMESKQKQAVDELGEDSDPIYIATVYRRHLIHIPESEPLYGISYIGQAVRSVDEYEEPEFVARVRWKDENSHAKREDKKVGLLAVLKMFGEDAFEDEVLHYMIGRQSVVQAWADKREKELVAEYGGVLQDMHKRLKQTLNLTKGGKGQQAFVGKVAYRNECFQRFKEEMEENVECYDTSLVPYNYVNPLTGFKLGYQLSQFRQGQARNGMPNKLKLEIEAWAESLPNWAWNALKTDEWRAAVSERSKSYWSSKEARDGQSERSKKQWTEAGDEAKSARSMKHKDTKRNHREIRLSQMAPEERSRKEAKVAWRERGYDNDKSDLHYLRTLGGEWTNAQFKDLPRARKGGVIPYRTGSDETHNLKSHSAKNRHANETTSAKAERLAKKKATDQEKINVRLANMTPKEREREETKIKRQRKQYENAKSDLEAVRGLGGEWSDVQLKDLPRARALGLIPNRNKKRKKRVTKTIVTEYKTETESSDEDELDELDEAIAGSSSSAPLPKRRRRDDSDSD